MIKITNNNFNTRTLCDVVKKKNIKQFLTVTTNVLTDWTIHSHCQCRRLCMPVLSDIRSTRMIHGTNETTTKKRTIFPELFIISNIHVCVSTCLYVCVWSVMYSVSMLKSLPICKFPIKKIVYVLKFYLCVCRFLKKDIWFRVVYVCVRVPVYVCVEKTDNRKKKHFHGVSEFVTQYLTHTHTNTSLTRKFL